jgi:uncharacterized membrane protein YccF (DUF307 family)
VISYQFNSVITPEIMQTVFFCLLIFSLSLPALDLYFLQKRRNRSNKELALVYLGNAAWMLTGGFWLYLLKLVSSVIMILSIVFVPFAFKNLKLSLMDLLPFGRKLEENVMSDKEKTFAQIANCAWMFCGGLLLCIFHVALAIPLLISVILIPIGLKHVNFATQTLFPFGKKVIFEGEQPELQSTPVAEQNSQQSTSKKEEKKKKKLQ